MKAFANVAPRHLLTAVVLATCLVGCKKADTPAADTTTAMTPAPDTSAMASAPSSASMSGDVPADPGISNFTDANIVAALSEGDEKEVSLSKSIAPKITNAELKDYGQMLITDHSKSKAEGSAVAKSAGIAPQEPAGDSSKKELADLKARFAKIPKGAAFDTALVNYAIQDHKQDIADHRAMEAQAKSQALKDEIEKGLPTLQKHLDRAVELSGKLK